MPKSCLILYNAVTAKGPCNFGYMRKETMRAAATTDDAADEPTSNTTQNAYTLYSDSTQALVLYQYASQ